MNPQKLLKKIYMKAWAQAHGRRNVHMPPSSAKLEKVPFTGHTIFVRPSMSDMARINELVRGIYFRDSYLHQELKRRRPSTLLDVGANIGSSSLSLVSEFPTIKTVYGIEAEQYNYGVLKKNYEHWSDELNEVEFISLHGVASASSDEKISAQAPLHSSNPRLSASGTFRFGPSAPESEQIDSPDTNNTIPLNEIVDRIPESDRIVCKIDIEGGEEHLFSKNTEWLSRVSYITLEIHDRFHPDLVNSSRPLLQALMEYNFAIVPEQDVLHCYSRKILA